MIRRLFSASASVSMRWRSISACFSTVAISSFSRRMISASCTLTCCSFSTCCTFTSSATHLLLHDVGLDLVGLVGLRLLLLDDLQVLGLLDVEVALRLGLLGLRQRLGEHALLVGLRLGDGGFARALRRA